MLGLNRITKEYSAGKRYCFSSADLLSLATALGWGTWLPEPSCGSERVGARGNSNPSATISVTRGVQSFRLSTELPGLRDKGGEALVEVLSKDELLEEWLVAEPGEPDYVGVLELEEIRGVDFVFAILRTWKEGTWLAIVISQGYITSTSGLRMLGVEEYSQLDHEGVPGSKMGTA
ncbi:hypothetical protein Cgig2_021190 [Carnegiea gigantea]|uniref:Uncharacterized protein n=1 Tax=Carnegiea gigantea TaxID=171969 RepID=A0A9Q1QPS2_9CARY|nr:hypothetical protein Cgig2_021190 [Carnegiea gigantea]